MRQSTDRLRIWSISDDRRITHGNFWYNATTMPTKPAVFALAVFIVTSAAAQNNPPVSKFRLLDIDLGAVHYQLRDDIVAPLRNDGFGVVGELTYSSFGDKGRHFIDLRVLYAPLSNRYDHISRAAELNLGYGYLWRIAGTESSGQLNLGGLIEWDYCLQYYDNWDDSHFYWLNVYELAPQIEWSNPLGDNHQLALSCSLSLLGLVSRPPKYRYYDQLRLDKIYSETHEQMDFASLPEYISMSLRGRYQFQAGGNFKLGVSYILGYKTYAHPERISLFSNNLQLDVLFGLGNAKRGRRE